MIEHPYAPFLHLVERPGRYLGGEFGISIPKPDALASIALAFPDTYEVGMSHMGLSILYELVNATERFSAERVYMPWSDMEQEIVSRGLPLVSLESARALREFDLVGFTLQHELNYTNIVAMLTLGGIPRRAAARQKSDPLIIAGGALAAHCEPMAPFIDLFVIGDGEQALVELLERYGQLKEQGADREQMIKVLAELPYVFAPCLLGREVDPISGNTVVGARGQSVARRAVIQKMDEHSPGHGPVPTVETVFNRYSVEVARGCAGGCRFCQAGFMYRPVRERSVAAVAQAVRTAVSCSGFDEVSLASLSTADYSGLQELLTGLDDEYTKERVSLSVPSLRAYGLSRELVGVLRKMRGTGVTLAPEAGSQRLRDVVNKNVTEEDLLAAAGRFFAAGQRRIKLYFMLGLPTETDEDLLAIVDLALRLRQVGRQKMGGRNPQIVISVSTFVPRPFTPFEREQMIPAVEIKRRQGIVSEACRRNKLDFRFHDPRLSTLEGLLCRGDIRLAEIIERAVDGGARFDGWEERFDDKLWASLLGELDTDQLLGAIDPEARLPWDHVDLGISESFLRRERQRALEERTTTPCGCFETPGEAPPSFVCHACGLACHRQDLPLSPDLGALRAEEEDDVSTWKKGKPQPVKRNELENLEPVKVRLTMAKTGRGAYVGHLDTVRVLARGLRRAGLKLYYSQGFHPKPKMEGGPPLPLGAAGMAEPFDVSLVEPPAPEEIVERLNRALPQDFRVKSAQLVDLGRKHSLGRAIETAHYTAAVAVDPQRARSAAEALLAEEKLELLRTRKGRSKHVDVRPWVLGIRVLDGVSPELGLPADSERIGIAFDLVVPGSGGVRVDELLGLMFEGSEGHPWVVRTGFGYREEAAHSD